MKEPAFTEVWLLHGLSGTPNGSVKQLEVELARLGHRLKYVRPLLPHADRDVAPSRSVEFLRSCPVPQNALVVGISMGGLVGAKLQELERPDLHVICINSPTWVGDTELKGRRINRVSLYSSSDSVIAGRTAQWPELAQAYDLPWLSGHDTDPHKRWRASMKGKTGRSATGRTTSTQLCRVVCISDTHELHRELYVPGGDLLIHAGDFTFFNHVSKIRDFNDWLGELPHRHKVVIPGNHDRVFHKDPLARRLITNAELLINESVTLCGLRIWGSPVTCDDAAYGHTKPEERASLYASIPPDTDILVTHGPPKGVLDRERGSDHRQGCPQLREAVLRLKPRLHVFGHVHVGYGVTQNKTTLFVNASLLGWAGDLENRPIVLDISAR